MEYVAGAWYPIETAPKDGEWVLVAVSKVWEDSPFCGVCQFRDGAWNLLIKDNASSTDYQTFGRPTHWSPLPKPPLTGGAS